MQVGVVGAGIVGATAALALAFADVIPLAAPGIIRKAPL